MIVSTFVFLYTIMTFTTPFTLLLLLPQILDVSLSVKHEALMHSARSRIHSLLRKN